MHSQQNSAGGQPIYYEIDTAFIPAQHFPAALMDLALSRGIEQHKIFRHTKIFYADIIGGNLRVTPEQCFQLMQNIQRQSSSQDLSFLLGHRLFPGNFGAASTALINAANLQEALDTLQGLSAILTPLLTPRIVYEQNNLVVYWQNSCGASDCIGFLVEMMCTALASASRWLGGEALPWTYYFAYEQPGYIEQYQVNLGDRIHFNAQHNAMVIAREYLYQPWVRASPSAALVAGQESRAALQTLPAQQGFLVSIYEYLQHHIQLNPNLEQTAADFCMSTASLKRKLQKHHSHFQGQYDAVRKDLAIYWLNQEGITTEQIASRLHFHDAANLRRAFKKWTGSTPIRLRLG